MYKIINAEGRELGITELPYYIRLTENGSFVPCGEKDAQGVAVDGTPYHLFGRESMGEELETVLLRETDGGNIIQEQQSVSGIVFVSLAESGGIDDVTASEHTDLFSPWAYPINYTVGQIRKHAGKLYKCLTAHTSQAEWTPDAAPSLWVAISDPADEWPEWSQPVGSTDAYAQGDKVSHGGKHWISDVDGNVWEPGVYGWSEEAE